MSIATNLLDLLLPLIKWFEHKISQVEFIVSYYLCECLVIIMQISLNIMSFLCYNFLVLKAKMH